MTYLHTGSFSSVTNCRSSYEGKATPDAAYTVNEIFTGSPGSSVPEGSTTMEERVNADTFGTRKTSRQTRNMK